jgi:hypothetical protein
VPIERRDNALGRVGVNVDVAFVNTNPEREGYEVTCGDCSRTAKLRFPMPEGKVALCRAGVKPQQ